MVKVKPKPKRKTMNYDIGLDYGKGKSIKMKGRRAEKNNKDEKKYYSGLLDQEPSIQKGIKTPQKKPSGSKFSDKWKRDALQKSYAKHDGRKKRKTRKDKGKAKVKDGEKVGELRKSITKYKQHIGLGATPKTKTAMMAFMKKHDIPIGYGG